MLTAQCNCKRSGLLSIHNLLVKISAYNSIVENNVCLHFFLFTNKYIHVYLVSILIAGPTDDARELHLLNRDDTSLVIYFYTYIVACIVASTWGYMF